MKRIVMFLPLLAASGWAQSGHWEGTIQAPSHPMTVSADLIKSAQGEWIGSFGMPEQKLTGMALSNIAVKDKSVGFEVAGVPGKPVFDGKISDDGQSITGNLNQGAATFPFTLKRTGDAKVELPAKSTSLAKEFQGTWEGTIDAGRPLNIILHLDQAADGTGTGSMDSPDQNANGIGITTITQTGKSLKFEIKVIQGSFAGDLDSAGTEIKGQWTQGPGSVPLTFKRPAAK